MISGVKTFSVTIEVTSDEIIDFLLPLVPEDLWNNSLVELSNAVGCWTDDVPGMSFVLKITPPQANQT
jgi:hypothetical protein